MRQHWALGLVCLARLMIGSRSIPPATVVEALTSFDGGDQEQSIVRDLRLPRTLIGLMVGAALGLTGTLSRG